jgi:hypothetical protein
MQTSRRFTAAVVLVLVLVLPATAADFLYSWPPSSAAGLQGYEVYQSTGGGPYRLLADIPVGSLADPQQPSYLATGLNQDTTYRFASAAVAASGTSAPDNDTCIVVGDTIVDCNLDGEGGSVVYISCFLQALIPTR